MNTKSMGSSMDDFLKHENIFEETQAQAITLFGCCLGFLFRAICLPRKSCFTA